MLRRERAASQVTTESDIESEYLAMVSDVVSDRQITREERERVQEFVKASGIHRDVRRRLHRELLRQLALTILVDGPIDETGRADLDNVSKLLGLEADDVDVAIVAADNESNQITRILTQASESPASTPGGTMLGKLQSGAGRFAGMMKSGAGSLVTGVAVLKQDHSMVCEQCGTPQPHTFVYGDKFPLLEWLEVLWRAKSLCPAGFVINAASLAIADRELMNKTGKSLLPEFRCKVCGKVCDRWESARLLMTLSTANKVS